MENLEGSIFAWLADCFFVFHTFDILILLWPLIFVMYLTGLDLSGTMVDHPDTMVALTDTMVDLPDTMVDLLTPW